MSPSSSFWTDATVWLSSLAVPAAAIIMWHHQALHHTPLATLALLANQALYHTSLPILALHANHDQEVQFTWIGTSAQQCSVTQTYNEGYHDKISLSICAQHVLRILLVQMMLSCAQHVLRLFLVQTSLSCTQAYCLECSAELDSLHMATLSLM